MGVTQRWSRRLVGVVPDWIAGGPGGSSVDIADIVACISEIRTILVIMHTMNSQTIC